MKEREGVGALAGIPELKKKSLFQDQKKCTIIKHKNVPGIVKWQLLDIKYGFLSCLPLRVWGIIHQHHCFCNSERHFEFS